MAPAWFLNKAVLRFGDRLAAAPPSEWERYRSEQRLESRGRNDVGWARKRYLQPE
jgi:hypothetical protein